MYDSQDREGGRPDARQDDSPLTVLKSTLHRFEGSDLACCCSLALLAHELSGGRRCQVELTGDGSGAAEDPDAPCRSATAEDGPGWHRLPVCPPGARGAPEAWLVVERHDGEGPLPDLERLSTLTTFAGLALGKHRLDREVRRARKEAKEIRGVLGHALRGHLHTALLRADSLLLSLPEEGEPDATRIREQLEALKDTVLRTVEEIHEVVDAPDAPGERSQRWAAKPDEALSIPELLREAAGRLGVDERGLAVDVEGQVPAVRADPRQLGSALEGLFELARRSQSAPTLSVRPEGSRTGARIHLSVELDAFTGPEGREGEEREADRPSLRDVVDRLGGRLRVEADDRTRATVVVILPAAEGD